MKNVKHVVLYFKGIAYYAMKDITYLLIHQIKKFVLLVKKNTVKNVLALLF